jgi:hypothetical protein
MPYDRHCLVTLLDKIPFRLLKNPMNPGPPDYSCQDINDYQCHKEHDTIHKHIVCLPGPVSISDETGSGGLVPGQVEKQKYDNRQGKYDDKSVIRHSREPLNLGLSACVNLALNYL